MASSIFPDPFSSPSEFQILDFNIVNLPSPAQYKEDPQIRGVSFSWFSSPPPASLLAPFLDTSRMVYLSLTAAKSQGFSNSGLRSLEPFFRNNSGLSHLRLSFQDLVWNPLDFAPLLGCSLRHLDLSGNPLGDGFCRYLSRGGLPLVSLDLADTGLTSVGLLDLASFLETTSTLESLTFSLESFYLFDAQLLERAFRRNSSLRALHLQGPLLVAPEASAIFWSSLRRFSALRLSECIWDTSFVRGLTQLLRDNLTLTYLDISVTYVYDHSPSEVPEEEMGEFLRALGSSGVSHLDLGNRRFQEPQTSELFLRGLAACPNLRILNLENWDLPASHAAPLCHLVREGALESLNLSGNKIRHSGLDDILEALAANTSLRRLDLERIGLKISTLSDVISSRHRDIYRVLASNTTLKDLKLAWDRIPIEMEVFLMELLERNNRWATSASV